MSETKPVIVWAGLRVKDGFAGDFIAAAQSVVDATRKEVGCVKYDLLQDVRDPCTFYFFEEYVSPAAFEAHRAMPYMDDFRIVRGELVDKFLGVRVMDEVSSR